jgi:hypothetical protein
MGAPHADLLVGERSQLYAAEPIHVLPFDMEKSLTITIRVSAQLDSTQGCMLVAFCVHRRTLQVRCTLRSMRSGIGSTEAGQLESSGSEALVARGNFRQFCHYDCGNNTGFACASSGAKGTWSQAYF